MKLAYICNVNPFEDKKSWSGTYYNVRRALENGGNTVDWVTYDSNSRVFILKASISKIINGRGIVFSRSIGKLKTNSIKQDLSKYDAIFVPGQSEIVSEINTKLPIIHYSDATVALMDNYYFKNISAKGLTLANEVEQRTINNSAINLYASEWAYNSAIKDYQANKNKTFVIPLGPGVEAINTDHNFGNDEFNIFFSGVDWNRKGGSLAIETVKILNAKGLKCRLTICGPRTLEDSIITSPYINYLGFLDKDNEIDRVKYINAWKNADLFLLPTRAECAGIVFSEAAEFGVPVIATDTGGVSTYVKNDYSGKLLPLSSGADEYANEIIRLIKMQKLDEFSSNSRILYKEKLSWKAWINSFETAITSCLTFS